MGNANEGKLHQRINNAFYACLSYKDRQKLRTALIIESRQQG